MGVEHPDWLPAGWKIEVRTRSCGDRRDKYYICPKSGLKFKSQPEVLRYLEGSGKCQPLIKIKQDYTIMNKVGEKMTMADLPAGWIKEIRTTKKRGRKVRRDAYYIDPVGGHCFRSIPEVMRHLHSKHGKINKLEDEGHSSAKSKGQASGNKKHYKNLSSIMKSGKKVGDQVIRSRNKTIKVQDDNQLEKNVDDVSIASDPSHNLQLSLNRVKREADKAIQVMKVVRSQVDATAILDRRLRSGSKAAETRTADLIYVKRRKVVKEPEREKLPDKPPQVNEKEDQIYGRRKSKRLHENGIQSNVNQHQSLHSENDEAKENLPKREGNELSSLKREKRSRGKCSGNEAPRRSSKRLAVLKVGSSVEPQCSNEARVGDEEKTAEEGIDSRPGSSDKPMLNNPPNPSPNKNEDAPFSEGNKDVVDAAQDKSEKQQIASPSSLKDLLMDPCIEFAVKTLTGAIPIEDARNVESSPIMASPSAIACSSKAMAPSSNIWSDPCFEFAVKTLTGELPMECGPKPQVSLFSPRIKGCSNSNNVSSSLNQHQGVKGTTSIFNPSL